MDVKELRTLPWIKADWRDMKCIEKNYVYGIDLDAFVESVCHEISRNTGFDYESVKAFIEEENSAFFTLKEQVYPSKTKCYWYDRSEVTSLQNIFRIPDMSVYPPNPVETALLKYRELSDEGKIEFLKKIGKIEVKISIEPKDELS